MTMLACNDGYAACHSFLLVMIIRAMAVAAAVAAVAAAAKGGEAALVDAVLVPLHLGQNHWALMVSVFLARHLSQLFLTRKTER
eukprot:COSAG06_NODE_5193_length_3646_cov_8.121229_8_plen_84_part_00